MQNLVFKAVWFRKGAKSNISETPEN